MDGVVSERVAGIISRWVVLWHEQDLHDGEVENECDSEALSNHVGCMAVRARHCHNKSHVQGHDNASDPESLFPAPAIDKVEAYYIGNRTDHSVDACQEGNGMTCDTEYFVEICLVVMAERDIPTSVFHFDYF